jgi:hypothetical protein
MGGYMAMVKWVAELPARRKKGNVTSEREVGKQKAGKCFVFLCLSA